MEARTFSALGDPSRLRIVELLRTGPLSVGEIANELDIRQPKASKCLRVLAQSGIVAAEPLGRRRLYRLEVQRFEQIVRWAESFERLWSARLDSLGRFLESADAQTPTKEGSE